MEDLILYEDRELVDKILYEKWNYLTFDICECTEEALDKKCKFILECQKIDWKPLKLEYKRSVRVYIKTFYLKKIN